MVTLNRIYTRTGDDGSTALGNGERRPKYDRRIDAYGTIDETNSVIGICRLHTQSDPILDEMLAGIQNDLFDTGADLCVPDGRGKGEQLRISSQQVERLERSIDELNARLSPLKSFVLPGGMPAAAYLHLARTVCRRSERLIVELASVDGEHVNENLIKYINRLSDFLFVASRIANECGGRDVLWKPGLNR